MAVLMPLWAAYLVKIYAWRTILLGNGIVDWLLSRSASTGPGLDELPNSGIVLSYLWLPYMILPIYAGLERIPRSLVEASSDLGGRDGDDVPPRHPAARPARRHRRLDLHLQPHPGRLHHAAAGVEHAVHRQRRSTTTSALRRTCRSPRPIATVPVIVIVVYLLVARRLGAFESL